VLISGKIGKDLINKYKQGQIVLAEEDIDKLVKLKLVDPPKKSKVSTPPKKQVENKQVEDKQVENTNVGTVQLAEKSITEKVPLTDAMRQKLKQYVQQWKEKKYIDNTHEQFCKTQIMRYVKHNIIEETISINSYIAFLQSSPTPSTKYVFRPNNLNESTMTFKHMQHPIASIKTNNYHVSHLYKNADDFKNSIDFDWIQKMNGYYMRMSARDIFTVVGYTYFGDTVCNTYLIDKFDWKLFFDAQQVNGYWFERYFPFFFQCIDILKKLLSSGVSKFGGDSTVHLQNPISKLYPKVSKIPDSLLGKKTITEVVRTIVNKNTSNKEKYLLLFAIAPYLSFDTIWKPAIELYIKELNTIIQQAPPLSKKMVVYRGVKTDYFLTGKEGSMYKNKTFVSTSMNLASAMEFAGKNHCCLKRITLLPGSKALLMMNVTQIGNESEVLLGMNTQYYITKNKTQLYDIPKDKICISNNDDQYVYVTDIVVVK